MAKYTLNETYFVRHDKVWEINIPDELLQEYMEENAIEDKEKGISEYMWSFEWVDEKSNKLIAHDDDEDPCIDTELDWELREGKA